MKVEVYRPGRSFQTAPGHFKEVAARFRYRVTKSLFIFLLITVLVAGFRLASREKKSDGPLFVRASGFSGPRILFLHGLLGSGAFWGPLVAEMGPNYRL